MLDRLATLRLPPRRVVLWQTMAAIPLASLVLLGAYLTYQYHEQSVVKRKGVDRAYEVLTSVNGLFAQIEDAEISELDYIITGDDKVLKPLTDALATAGFGAVRSAALVSDDAEQSRRMIAFEQGIANKLRGLGKEVELRRLQGFDAAKAQMDADRADEATDTLRAQATGIVEAEYGLLQRRQAASQAHERSFLRISIAMAGLSIATRLLVAWAVRRVSKREQQAVPIP